ncbi:acetylornithine deacetylase [Roseovarius sp. M141]|uniref:acetylornithine deacetylase n=1 Tax=Roseovarius sp. M141 TaxID=2583806 RepID=UPI0020CF7B03|nr:acetylornithine deacetylase [Roseovarius sp. M141]
MACQGIYSGMGTLDILERLIAFPSVSRTPNRDLIAYIAQLLDDVDIHCETVGTEDGARANLFATIGPQDRPGVMLSGHTDVVPTEGQNWSSDPFRMRRDGARYYGRGTTDMKGFVAAAIHAARLAATRDLKTPLHLAFSYDEEIGCVGVRSLIDALEPRAIRPSLCIVGEPTGMAIAIGHKGKTALRATCTGHASHSALAPEGVNALHLGADFMARLRARQADIAENGAQDPAYSVPYTTLHAGIMHGGVQLNIVPDHCTLDFEIRNIAADDPATIVAGLHQDAAQVVAPYRDSHPHVAIDFAETNTYPGLETDPESAIVAFLRDVTGSNDPAIKVAFGTEGGLFHNRLGIATAVCGPGHMAQGHKPDEFIDGAQLDACDAMLARVLDRLEAGL